jgi:protein involved in polysaccharide export with SLBB domain
MRFALLLGIGALTAAANVAAQSWSPFPAPAQPPATSQPPPAAAPAPETAPSVFGSPSALPRPATPTVTGAPPAPAEAPPAPPAPPPQTFDYSVNLRSDVFGAHLFTGAFTRGAAAIFNPNHVIAIGDQLQLRLWGAVDYEALLTVDPQGNVFMPQVGPIRVAGIANRDLQKTLEDSVRRIFRSNVYSYISLAAAQPVRVFVTGFVYRPGMYPGTSSDSVLRYLDQAGGIDTERGSFLEVLVMRGAEQRARFNLYEFLLSGSLPGVQLADGDVIMVAPRKSSFRVIGLAENAKRFEFDGRSIELARLAALAKPMPQATHVRVNRNTGTVRNTEYYALEQAGSVQLAAGDEIEFTADKRPGTITVRVEGEHVGAQEYVLPHGARIGELMKQIKFSERSDVGNVQLYRTSVKERQRLLLQNALKSLEAAVLTARSGTSEEARLRTDEAQLVLQWVARARTVEPLGLVLVAQAHDRDELPLENGDVVRIPVKDGLVLVNGEVLFPNAVAFDQKHAVGDYIKRAGGYAQNADTSRIVLAHRDGSFSESAENSAVRAGDEILVLPRIDTKSRQFWKDITQIMFQIAVSAKVVLGL